jgi:hypothetical protein
MNQPPRKGANAGLAARIASTLPTHFMKCGPISGRERHDQLLDLAVVCARDGDAAPHRRAEFGNAVLAGALDPRDPTNGNNVAAMHAPEEVRV